MKKSAAILGSTIAAVAGVAMAESTRLEEVNIYGKLSRYSALKSETPIMETARHISIISKQKMIDGGALALDYSYTYTAGVIGETYGYATRGDWVKVRGLNVPQYQDSLQSLFGNYNNTRPNIYTLEQVEILKGPASVLYGQGSPGGLINVVSKRPQAESAHELVADYGNFNYTQLALDSTGTIFSSGDWLYRFVGVYEDSDTQVDHVGEDNIVVAPSLTWRPSDSTEATLMLNYTSTKSDTAAQFLPVVGTLERAPNGKRIDSSSYFGDTNFNKYDASTVAVTLLASHRFNDIWSMELTSRYTDAKADYKQAWPSFIGGDRYVYNADGSLYKDGTVPRTFYRSDATSKQAAVDARLRADFDTGPLTHNVLMGTQYQDVTTGDAGYNAYALGYAFELGAPTTPLGDEYWINLFDPVYGSFPPSELLNALYEKHPDTTVDDLGVNVSDFMSYGNWHMTLGARWDQTKTDAGSSSQEDDEISTSAGLLYQFANGFAPYVNYAESFEPVIGDNGNGQPLKPQKGEQAEIVIKYQPDSFPAMVTLAWFDLKQSNLPDPQSRPGEFEQQSGDTKIKGLEFEGVAQLGAFRVELNLSKLDTRTQDGYRLASVPEKQASSWVSWRPEGSLQGLKAGVGVRYVGASWGGTDQIKTPSYTLGDMMLGWEQEHWDIALNVRNVTDKDYYATCLARGDCFVGDRRTVVGRVSYRF